jgi:hypothetical protein
VIVPPAGTCALRVWEKPDSHVSHGLVLASVQAFGFGNSCKKKCTLLRFGDTY